MKDEDKKAYESALVAINAGGHELRVCRSIIDGKSFTAPDDMQADLKEFSDELSKIIVRVNKVTEMLRAACLKGSK